MNAKSGGGPDRWMPAISAATGFGALFTILSATALPHPKTNQFLLTHGFSEREAAAALHTAPVLMCILVVMLVALLPLQRGIRVVALALSGGWVGFFLGRCLKVFAGAGAALGWLTGPLTSATPFEFLGWVESLLFLVFAFCNFGIQLFGKQALEALTLRRLTEEQVESTQADRINIGRGAWCALLMGFALGILTLLHQANAAPGAVKAGLAVSFCLALAFGGWLQWSMYRSMDELLRLATMQAFAVSGVIATVGLGLWAAGAEFAGGKGPGGFEAFVAFYFVQTLVALVVSTRMFSPNECAAELELGKAVPTDA